MSMCYGCIDLCVCVCVHYRPLEFKAINLYKHLTSHDLHTHTKAYSYSQDVTSLCVLVRGTMKKVITHTSSQAIPHNKCKGTCCHYCNHRRNRWDCPTLGGGGYCWDANHNTFPVIIIINVFFHTHHTPPHMPDATSLTYCVSPEFALLIEGQIIQF